MCREQGGRRAGLTSGSVGALSAHHARNQGARLRWQTRLGSGQTGEGGLPRLSRGSRHRRAERGRVPGVSAWRRQRAA